MKTGSIVGVILLALGLPVAAAGQGTDARLARGVEAFEAGRYAEAVEALEAAVRDDPALADAYYYLARIFLETPLLDPGRAKDAIKKALRRDPDDVRYLEVELWRKYFHGSSFLPLYQAKKRIDLADRILERDPDNAVAHFVLGAWAFEGFRENFHAVDFGSISRRTALLSLEEAAMTDAAFLLEARLGEADGEPSVVFVDELGSGFEVPTTSRHGAALTAYDDAVAHLRRALAAAPAWRDVYTLLMRAFALRGAYADAFPVLDTMRVHFPDDPDTWLYRGYFQLRTEDFEGAAESFARGIALLPARERRAFEDVAYFLPLVEQVRYDADSSGVAERFWESRDPRFLTPVNERLLEHDARLVYADLRFGEMEEGKRGWESEPGQVVVRYGEPPAEVRYSTRADKYMVFHYGDFHFKFMDLAKAGRFYFYSPSAADFEGFRPPPGVWENDFAIRGPETFRKTPDRFDFETARRVSFPFRTSAFKGEDGATDLYVTYGVPVPPEEAVRTGAFLVKGNDGLAAEHRRTLGPGQGPVAAFTEATYRIDTHTLHVPGGKYTLSVEFDPVATDSVEGFERTRIALTAFPKDRLRLSDVMFAYGVEEAGEDEPPPGWIHRRDLAILPAPWGVFHREAPIYFYFEMYNLARDPEGRTRYEVEAVLVKGDDAKGLEKLIRKAFGGGRATGVSARFEGRGTAADEGQYLILDASSEQPGAYVLAVRVKDLVRGTTAEARRDLRLE
ncbi:tetratricopeptide repeat protein [Rhodocaloribacter sp.]